MAELFGVNVDTIGLHIRNIYREEELETSTYEESSVVRLEGKRQVKRSIRIYDLAVFWPKEKRDGTRLT